jgi:dihydrodipicolinate synthase/N-acetylneuraminate lyase
VSEHRWHELGPVGAIGSASALVYMNPRLILHMFDLMQKKDWDRLEPWADKIKKLTFEGLSPFTEKGFQDSAYDHMLGLVTGFLAMSPRSRPPYTSATWDDIAQLRSWLDLNLPEFLRLDTPVVEHEAAPAHGSDPRETDS